MRSFMHAYAVYITRYPGAHHKESLADMKRKDTSLPLIVTCPQYALRLAETLSGVATQAPVKPHAEHHMPLRERLLNTVLSSK